MIELPHALAGVAVIAAMFPIGALILRLTERKIVKIMAEAIDPAPANGRARGVAETTR